MSPMYGRKQRGCAKQDICSLAVYLMTILTLIFNISIGREIGVTSHGKDVVDGLNSRYQIYFRELMNRLLNILPQLLKDLVCFSWIQ